MKDGGFFIVARKSYRNIIAQGKGPGHHHSKSTKAFMYMQQCQIRHVLQYMQKSTEYCAGNTALLIYTCQGKIFVESAIYSPFYLTSLELQKQQERKGR